ncbi:MAG: 3TM-type holin [Ghiorsea sp.]
MNFLSIISDVFKPAAALISEAIEDKDKANELRSQMYRIEAELSSKALDYERDLMQAQASIISAEAKGESWLQRNWRPMMMMWFAGLLGMYWFGMTPDNMSQETLNKLFDLIQIGIGGYIVGRSAEKIVPSVASAMKRG